MLQRAGHFVESPVSMLKLTALSLPDQFGKPECYQRCSANLRQVVGEGPSAPRPPRERHCFHDASFCREMGSVEHRFDISTRYDAPPAAALANGQPNACCRTRSSSSIAIFFESMDVPLTGAQLTGLVAAAI